MLTRQAFLRLCAAAARLQPSAFDERVEQMNRAWNEFYRALHGCSAEALRIEECREGDGHPDRRAFEAARQAAKRLFDLRDA
ncbi:MAG TPA: hypothetical protein VFA33_07510 [Bryobacteraceae bacterium]|nr:hypothetical protein [Bryobacteraceae bacterium]